jgi:hypothetical protein
LSSRNHRNTPDAVVAAILTIYMIEDGVEVVRVVTFGQPRFTTADGVKRLSFLSLARVVVLEAVTTDLVSQSA